MTPTKPLVDADISALMDDHLDVGHAHDAIARLLASGDAQATWHCYHLIGDIMRSDALAPCAAELGFAQRVMDSLDKQPSVIPEQVGPKVITRIDVAQKMTGANAAEFRIKAVAGVLVACLISFLLVGLLRVEKESPAPQVVVSQSKSFTESVGLAAVEDRLVINRDPELDALLSAHEQMGGHSALQTPSGFLRNATFDRSKR